MKRMLASVAVLLLMPLLTTAQVSTFGVTAKIDFGFHAGATLLPAGTYEFKPGGEKTPDTLSITDTKTGKVTVLAVITTISKKLPADGEVVFDKTPSDYYLTEVFIPTMDGFLVKGAPGKHTHVTVKATK